jgi:tRNA pseudouridine38-40 synthase
MYRLYSWHLHRPLAVDVMESAAKQFLGTHDFSSFANLRAKQPICTLKSVECVREEGRLRIALRADRFLYKMARNLVGTLVAIGRGHLDGKSISELLSSQKRTRIGMTAPARGLFLSEVIYTPST